jgi:hypothetical protein
MLNIKLVARNCVRVGLASEQAARLSLGAGKFRDGGGIVRGEGVGVQMYSSVI